MRATLDTVILLLRKIFCRLFPALFLPALLSGCALSPVADDSVWRSARGITEAAVAEGKAVVIVQGRGGAVWQSVSDPAVTFDTASRRKPLDDEYGVIVIKPGTYVLTGGPAVIDGAVLHLKAAGDEYRSSRLGRVELRNKDLLQYYEAPVYVRPEINGWWGWHGGFFQPGWNMGYWSTRTFSRVVGHYVECDIISPGKDAAGRPLWAAFSIGPGEVAVLRTVGFTDPRPNYDQCRSTAMFGGEWSCPLEEVTLTAEEAPPLAAVSGVASRAGFSPALRARMVIKEIEFGSEGRSAGAAP